MSPQGCKNRNVCARVIYIFHGMGLLSKQAIVKIFSHLKKKIALLLRCMKRDYKRQYRMNLSQSLLQCSIILYKGGRVGRGCKLYPRLEYQCSKRPAVGTNTAVLFFKSKNKPYLQYLNNAVAQQVKLKKQQRRNSANFIILLRYS